MHQARARPSPLYVRSRPRAGATSRLHMPALIVATQRARPCRACSVEHTDAGSACGVAHRRCPPQRSWSQVMVRGLRCSRPCAEHRRGRKRPPCVCCQTRRFWWHAPCMGPSACSHWRGLATSPRTASKPAAPCPHRVALLSPPLTRAIGHAGAMCWHLPPACVRRRWAARLSCRGLVFTGNTRNGLCRAM